MPASGGFIWRPNPRTEIQAYGNTAILYTTYEMDLVAGGKRTTERGAATEVFVRRDRIAVWSRGACSVVPCRISCPVLGDRNSVNP